MNFIGNKYGGKGQIMSTDGVFGTPGPNPPNSMPCDIESPLDATASSIAAKNLVDNGFIHSFDVDNDLGLFKSNHPIMSIGDDKIKISPQIILDNYVALSPSSLKKPEDAAQYLHNKVLSYKILFQSVHPDKVFRWSLKWKGFGGIYDGKYPGTGINPNFISHTGDVITKDYEVSEKANGFWNGLTLKFTSGSMIDQSFTISGWINSTKIITVSTMPATPQHGDRFIIINGLNTYASRVDNREEVFSATNTQFRVFSFLGFVSGHHCLENRSSVSGNATRSTTVFGVQRNFEQPYTDKDLSLYWKNYESDYFDENKQDRPGFCEITFDNTCKTTSLRGIKRKVVGWDPVNCLLTVSPSLPEAPSAPSVAGPTVSFDSFVIRRVRNSGDSSITPEDIFFFKNAKIDVEQWVIRFKAKMLELISLSYIPDPDIISFSHEDLQYGKTSFVRWDGIFSYYELNLQDDKASDSSYTIDGTLTLKQWDTLYRKDKEGNRLEFPFSYDVDSPLAQDIRSYLVNTWSTAYNYHFSKAVWDNLVSIWPKTKCVQYQLGSGVGSSSGPSKIGPNEDSYHGIKWNHSISSELKYSIISNAYSSGYYNAQCSTSGFSASKNQFKISSESLNSILLLFSGSSPLFSSLSFSWRSGAMNKKKYKINSIQHRMPEDDYILTVDTMDSVPLNLDYGIITGFPGSAYQEYVSYNVKWGLLPFYLDRYGQLSTSTGYTNASKYWAIEKVKSLCKSFPENSIAVYAFCGLNSEEPYNEDREWLGFEYTYPGEEFYTKDGYLDGNDWGDILTSCMNSGVNQFIWVEPNVITDLNVSDSLTLDVLYQAILKQKQAYYSNIELFRKIADGC